MRSFKLNIPFYMKHVLIILFAAFLSISTWAQDLNVLFNSKQFNLPSDSLSLVENYLNISAHSVKFKPNQEGQLQAKVEVIQLYKQAETIVDFKKYILSGIPVGADSIAQDLLDQQRFTLAPGLYDYELEIKDLNVENPIPLKLQEQVEVNDFSKELIFSDIQLIDSYAKAKETTAFTKSGYTIVPLVENHLPSDFIKVAYYAELYNSQLFGDKFLLIQFIEDYETSRQLRKYARMTKVEGTEVVPVLNAFNIEELPSGKYNIVIQLKDSKNTIISEKKLFFTRENPTKFNVSDYLSEKIENTFVSTYTDSMLNRFIPSLMPLGSNLEKAIIKRADSLDLDKKKRFFYSFWKERNEGSPQEEWRIYYEKVKEVERLYSTQIKKGYETDRGRIYLKFGAPNSLVERPNEPSAYPYEIWHYYRIGRFSNRRFVFYQPDLVTNDYELLHSDYPGERYNYRWKIDLQKRNQPFNSIDDTDPINSSWGSQQDDLYLNPR